MNRTETWNVRDMNEVMKEREIEKINKESEACVDRVRRSCMKEWESVVVLSGIGEYEKVKERVGLETGNSWQDRTKGYNKKGVNNSKGETENMEASVDDLVCTNSRSGRTERNVLNGT